MTGEEHSVEFKDGMKVTTRRGKISEEEKKESKKNREKAKKIFDEVTISGEWWRIWNRKEVKENLNKNGFLDVVEEAIEELKDVFTSDWFRDEKNRGHPMYYILRSALSGNPIEDSLPALLELVTIGNALDIVGKSDRNLIEDLRGKRNFYSRAFELRIKAFLKSLDPPAILEDEFINRAEKVPDAKWNNYDFEIKHLDESSFDIEFRTLQEMINKELKEFFSSLGFTGDITYNAELKSITSTEGLKEIKDIFRTLLTSSKEKLKGLLENGENKIDLGNEYINIEIHFVQGQNWGVSGFVKTPDPLPLHAHRVARVVREEISQKGGENPVIAVINPPKSFVFYFAHKALGTAGKYFIFTPKPTPRENRVLKEKQSKIKEILETTNPDNAKKVIYEIIEDLEDEDVKEVKELLESNPEKAVSEIIRKGFKDANKVEDKLKEQINKLNKVKELWLFLPLSLPEIWDAIKNNPNTIKNPFFAAVVVENPFFGLDADETLEKNKNKLSSFMQTFIGLSPEEALGKDEKDLHLYAQKHMSNYDDNDGALSPPKMVIGASGGFFYLNEDK